MLLVYFFSVVIVSSLVIAVRVVGGVGIIIQYSQLSDLMMHKQH